MKKWIKNRLIIIILLLLIIYSSLTIDKTSTWGFNKTVGWLWDLTNLTWLIPMVFWLTLIFIYGLFAVFKISTNYVLSIIQLAFLVLVLAVTQLFPHEPYFGFILTFAGLLVLIINAIVSIRNKLLVK